MDIDKMIENKNEYLVNDGAAGRSAESHNEQRSMLDEPGSQRMPTDKKNLTQQKFGQDQVYQHQGRSKKVPERRESVGSSSGAKAASSKQIPMITSTGNRPQAQSESAAKDNNTRFQHTRIKQQPSQSINTIKSIQSPVKLKYISKDQPCTSENKQYLYQHHPYRLSSMDGGTGYLSPDKTQ